MDASFVAGVASIIVGTVAAVSGFAAQRSASRASVQSTEITTQADALDQAYERARKFDMATIGRQDSEIDELRKTNLSQSHSIRKLRESDRKQQKEIRELNDHIDELRAQVTALKLENASLKAKKGG
jgi:predicted RNase H-like nuclease (RuvC/YqgF family)